MLRYHGKEAKEFDRKVELLPNCGIKPTVGKLLVSTVVLIATFLKERLAKLVQSDPNDI